MLNTESKDLTNSKLRNQWRMKLIDADLPSKTKLLAFIIEARLNHKTLQCWPSNKSLMMSCKISKPTLISALKRLEKDEWITRQPRKATTNIYSIVVNKGIKQGGKVEGPGIGKHEASTIDKIEGVGKVEGLGVGKVEEPGTLSSNLQLIDPSKEISTGAKIDQSKIRPKLDKVDVSAEDIIIDKLQVIDYVEGMYWLKNGGQISAEDVEKLKDGGSLKVLRMSEDVDLRVF